MIQQTVVPEVESGLDFLGEFFKGSDEKAGRKKIIEFLSDDYSAAVRIAANLSSHSKWIPYQFLLNRLKRIADEVRTQADIFRAELAELGGQIPQVSMENRDLLEFRQNVKRLVTDVEEHSSRCETLMHQKNVVRDEGVLRLIDAVIVDMQRQKDELIDIVMRLS